LRRCGPTAPETALEAAATATVSPMDTISAPALPALALAAATAFFVRASFCSVVVRAVLSLRTVAGVGLGADLPLAALLMREPADAMEPPGEGTRHRRGLTPVDPLG